VLFSADILERIAAGDVTLAFRRWRRPTVRAGGTLVTPAGVLGIDALEVVPEDAVTDGDAVRAGHPDRASVLAALAPEGRLYRITFHRTGPDPRVALRETDRLAGYEVAGVLRRLARLDAASTHGPWVEAVLTAIRDRPGVVAAQLAASFGRERLAFKADVRKLKALGLTESLPVGYRISPRGEAILRVIEGRGDT
jgi:hypothetical protein